MKRLFIVCGVVVVGIAGVYALVLGGMALDDFVGFPPGSATANTMLSTKGRILEFAQSHDQLPHSLSDLPARQGYDNSIVDEWGRRIAYEVSPSGLVTLTSLGRDGKRGGTGKDTDLVLTFPSHDLQGRWSSDLIGESQWEYKVVRLNSSEKDFEAQLKANGEGGWKVLGAVRADEGGIPGCSNYVFQRPKR